MATYKQPRRINAVSVTLLGLVVVAGYAGYAAWPVIALNADVKSVIEDALPHVYRANLLPEPESSAAAAELRPPLVEKLTALGIATPDEALVITRDARTVAITVRVATAIDLKIIHRRIPLVLNPHVATSAERVSY